MNWRKWLRVAVLTLIVATGVPLAGEWERYEKLGLAPLDLSGKYIEALVLAYSDFVDKLKHETDNSQLSCYSQLSNYLIKIEQDNGETLITFTPHFSPDSECFDTFGGGGKYWIDPVKRTIRKKLFFE